MFTTCCCRPLSALLCPVRPPPPSLPRSGPDTCCCISLPYPALGPAAPLRRAHRRAGYERDRLRIRRVLHAAACRVARKQLCPQWEQVLDHQRAKGMCKKCGRERCAPSTHSPTCTAVTARVSTCGSCMLWIEQHPDFCRRASLTVTPSFILPTPYHSCRRPVPWLCMPRLRRIWATRASPPSSLREACRDSQRPRWGLYIWGGVPLNTHYKSPSFTPCPLSRRRRRSWTSWACEAVTPASSSLRTARCAQCGRGATSK